MDKENAGQGRDRRSDTANAHAQDIYKNPTLTGNFPGQGNTNRSDRANSVAKNTSRNPNLVIREGEASVELGGDISGGENTSDTSSSYVVNGQSEFIWYYHPDHLGSTGFVTDANGELYEHVEHFPFGETRVQEHSNTQRTQYLFTGKELDEETQLYYYGARYYDPRTSVWQSADPILGSYLDGKPNGGVFSSITSAFYGYVSRAMRSIRRGSSAASWTTCGCEVGARCRRTSTRRRTPASGCRSSCTCTRSRCAGSRCLLRTAIIHVRVRRDRAGVGLVLPDRAAGVPERRSALHRR